MRNPSISPRTQSDAAQADFGKPSLRHQVTVGYRRGTSEEGTELALGSALLARLQKPGTPSPSKLDADGWARLALWLDLYGQYAGAFSPEQEQELTRLRAEWAPLLNEPTQAAK